jgi:hypothetical protein
MRQTRRFEATCQLTYNGHGQQLRDFILKAVNERHLTVAQLARELNISRQTLYAYAMRYEVQLESRCIARDLRAERLEAARAQAVAEQAA